jgi:membrane-associated protein
MTDWLLGLVPQYGLYLLAICTFASCLALPIPASILMLAAGGFVASEDLDLAGSMSAALLGAMAGDQVGYLAGRWGGVGLVDRIGKRAAPLARATDLLARKGGIAVFLTRWLLSALGPYINVAAGAAGTPWSSFTLWGLAGEGVWVGLYVGVGYTFTGNLVAASAMAVNILGFLAAGAVAMGLGWWLVASLRAERAAKTKGRTIILPHRPISGPRANPD